MTFVILRVEKNNGESTRAACPKLAKQTKVSPLALPISTATPIMTFFS